MGDNKLNKLSSRSHADFMF